MFRPLEAIFRLHKIDLEEKEYNIYIKRNGVSTRNNAEISTLIHRCAYYICCIPSLPDLLIV